MYKKYPDQVTNEWDPAHAKQDSKQHLYITNTYLNTKLALEANSEDKKLDAAGIQDQLQGKVPKNNRNINMKSNTYNDKAKKEEGKGSIRWVDQATDKPQLYDVIVDKPRSKLKEAVMAHRSDALPNPIIKVLLPKQEPLQEANHTTTNIKQLQNGPLVFNMHMQKHIDDSFEQAKQVKRKQLQKDDSKGKPFLLIISLIR